MYKDYLSWIGKAQDRIILDGSGYSENIATIGASFSTCKFGLHIYPWYGNYTTESAWMNAVVTRIGGYQKRTRTGKKLCLFRRLDGEFLPTSQQIVWLGAPVSP